MKNTAQNTVEIDWPFNTQEYFYHCADHGLSPKDADSVQHFRDEFKPGLNMVGICSLCLVACAPEYERFTDMERCGETLHERPSYEFVGSGCCRKPILNSHGKELDL